LTGFVISGSNQKEVINLENKKPIKVFKAGGVKSSVWANTIKRDVKDVLVHSVQIDRTYKQGEEFKRTNSFNVQDLPKVQLVAAKAFEFLSLKHQDNIREKESK